MKDENLFTPHSMRTYTGKYFDYSNPTVDMVCIEDIAHALSHIPRFNGHTKHHYSVAEHCVECWKGSKDCSPLLQLTILLHDASEAYCTDIPRPLKLLLPDYQKIEKQIEEIIATKFGLMYPYPSIVKNFDMKQLQFEWECYMLKSNRRNLTHQQSEREFIIAYERISEQL